MQVDVIISCMRNYIWEPSESCAVTSFMHGPMVPFLKPLRRFWLLPLLIATLTTFAEAEKFTFLGTLLWLSLSSYAPYWQDVQGVLFFLCFSNISVFARSNPNTSVNHNSELDLGKHKGRGLAMLKMSLCRWQPSFLQRRSLRWKRSGSWRRVVSEVWCATSPRREVGEGGGCQNSFEWHLILALCA